MRDAERASRAANAFKVAPRTRLASLSEELGWKGDARQLVLDVIALCYFPFAYTQTLRPLGLNVRDPDFLVQRKQHVIRQVLGEEDEASTR